MNPASNEETSYGNNIFGQFTALNDMTAAGPGQQDVTRSTNSSRDFATMLQDYSKTGGMPSQSDISSTQGVAQNLFAPQRVASDQAFQDALDGRFASLDTLAPSAQLLARNNFSPDELWFTVRYTDDVAIDLTDLDTSDITVTSPAGVRGRYTSCHTR